ncbi:3',5'-cyclic-nucleotide phosphodiesterase [Rahnella sp. SAP-1]|uniref:3',5'-cyclic-nucleotide phosphodiesterase n=1 Tax=Rouxiella aceris TaxID=2703884 RepID=A0A848MGM9_9GAMM|nr:3',5'-cyclic-nucleotide phosphodiesterase [Rouxiella aceris]NMP26311.1 3',5'-cyclic-nucleotide phosphodiesterase [Rouxiella aceris]
MTNRFGPRILLLGAGFCAAFSANAGFQVVALGVNGGVEEGNLTSYLIRSDSQPRYLALDAGSVLPGIEQALAKGSFPEVNAENSAPLTPQGAVFRNLISGYFISHAHLDHIAGLIIASPQDSRKPIYGSAETISALRQYVFNWKLWPNFTDAGSGQRLGTYRLNAPRPGQRFSLSSSGLDGVIYPLSHGGVTSSMLLISRENESFAFFGDTGADKQEKSRDLNAIWRVLADEIRQRRLKGIIIETSFVDETPDAQLFGHLTPALLLTELTQLEQYAGGAGSLKGLKVVISHIKPSLLAGVDPRAEIRRQLEQGDRLGVNFIFMQQGDSQHF